MNSQKQSAMTNSSVASSSGSGQRSGLPQKGGQQVSFNPPHQQQASQYQPHQQPIVSENYQKLKKHQQSNSEVASMRHQYVGTNGMSSTLSQNGSHQTGHSGLVLDTSQQHTFPHATQYQHPQLQQYQQPQLHNNLSIQQQQPQPQVAQHPELSYQHSAQHQQLLHHQLKQQQQQQQQSPVSINVSQSGGYQQHIQIQQQIEQRNVHQQQHRQHHHQRNHHHHKQSQPKHILQKPSSGGKSATAVSSQPQMKEEPPLVIDTFSADGQCDMENSGADQAQVEEKSHMDTEETKSNGTNEANEEPSLANTKEKTPMCLINELARFNKVSHQYTLVDEQGPAHKKIFYVKLKLGNEEYSASGESIKKAQHAAAAIALNETQHPHPPPKPPRQNGNLICPTDENITPTVELNALAMKRGEATIYKAIEPQQPPYYPQPGMDPRGFYNHRYHQFMRATRDPRYRGGGVLWPLRYHYPRMNRAFYVSLRVGHREFIGDGPTRQAARHNAAQKALRVLKNLPVQNEPKETQGGQVASSEQAAESEVAPLEPTSENDDLKSEISLVHEVALRRNMLVTFEVIRETGPPHMKMFVTRCTVSDKVTEGEGNSKKASKKKAAELMLEELKKLPPAPAPIIQRPKCKVQLNKKKNRNIIKSELQLQKADPNYGVGINPISRLIQIMQAQKKKEPVYTLVSERGLPRRREFVMQVEVEEKTCSGTGPNKKLAKRAAAEAMLLILGYTKPSPQPTKSSIKSTASSEGHGNGDKKVHFVGDAAEPEEKPPQQKSSSASCTQQKVPGILHLPTNVNGRSPLTGSVSQPQPKEPLINLASILKPSLRPEIQLRELCKALDQQLEIDDFTKKTASGTEHITRITVGKDPGQSRQFHGSSTTLESSRDSAALDALKMLLGRVKELHPGGDGPQVRKELLTRSSLSLKKETK